jgi:hypothetical protein
MTTDIRSNRDVLRTVQVRDPNGHRSVFLEGLRPSATVAEIRARAASELRLTEEVDWNVRHDGSGRLLQEEQRLADFAGDETQVLLTMQPDAGLG